MKKKLEIIGLLLSWFAIITQFILIIENRVTSVPETVIRFFSFFTILTNLLVAIYFTVHYFGLKNKLFSLFIKPTTLTAITVFILIVGSVYQIALRHIWQPTGLQRIVDELLHTIIPLYFLMYWFLNSKKEGLNIKRLLSWLLYPLLYSLFIFIRGYFSNYYPYPFLNIEEIGMAQTVLNMSIILAVTVLFMLTLTLIGRKRINNLK